MPSLKALLASTALVTLASAETIRVTANSDNRFDPDTITAREGDLLEFFFEGRNHSVVSGDYDYPCTPEQIGTGFYSGFFPVDGDDNEADDIFRVRVNSTDPIIFYSSQGEECTGGMVGIINQDGERNLTDYRDRASELARAVSPPAPYGGERVDADEAESGGGNGNDDNNGDDGDEGNDDGNDNNGGDEDEDDAAGSVRVNLLGLLGVTAFAFFLA